VRILWENALCLIFQFGAIGRKTFVVRFAPIKGHQNGTETKHWPAIRFFDVVQVLALVKPSDLPLVSP